MTTGETLAQELEGTIERLKRDVQAINDETLYTSGYPDRIIPACQRMRVLLKHLKSFTDSRGNSIYGGDHIETGNMTQATAEAIDCATAQLNTGMSQGLSGEVINQHLHMAILIATAIIADLEAAIKRT